MSVNSVTDIAWYRTELVKTFKETFFFKRELLPLDRNVLSDRYRALLENINGFVFLCNYTTAQYEYISDSIKAHLGYDVRNYSPEELTDFTLNLIHEKHREFMMNTFAPAVFSYLKENATLTTGMDYRYTCSMLLKNIHGVYQWFLVDTNIIEVDENGFPVRTLITCTNIHQFKKDDTIYYNMLKKNHEGIYEVIFEGTENNTKTEYQLTQRELQIISLISQGYTNKEIAEMLYISVETAKTHRKNLLKKTHCKGTAELANFAFSRGLL
jgi:DNA-binding CsgD family transcriptional regulator